MQSNPVPRDCPLRAMVPAVRMIEASEDRGTDRDGLVPPDIADLRRLKRGDLVKVAVRFDPVYALGRQGWDVLVQRHTGQFGLERFWVTVLHTVESSSELLICGLVSNDLVHTRFHGLRLKDPVALYAEYALALVRSEEREAIFGAQA